VVSDVPSLASRLLDFYYSVARAPDAKRVRITPSAGAATSIVGAVADWVWVVLASGLI